MEPIQNTQAFPNICNALIILSSKWAFPVMAELSNGPMRFKQLQRSTKVITTQSLTDTLRMLEKAGVVNREVFPTVPVTVEYSLTESGIEFKTVLNEMDNWATKWGKPVLSTSN
ncbi:winged helix-turn-helix transcriptional regulator [Cohnella terricola]|uniref:Helix-turn-helix transcriptional regulator n=1 Tax=Cohnella terricola TaxID=1289167 RepID=A0A559JQR9_9BACL|nr:helix-turn-helix domain-containing protein [Cohnella terricola]TVY02208.1 helix-turn-helix transcriptional regulator [Cohnella terricola]